MYNRMLTNHTHRPYLGSGPSATASGFRRAIESAALSFCVQLTSTFAGKIERIIAEFDGRTGGDARGPDGQANDGLMAPPVGHL
jgi:hypothetical protein